MSQLNETTGSSTWTYVAVAVVAVLIGAALAPYAASYSRDLSQGPSDAVAVISIDGPISSHSVDAASEDLREARENESIKAVVLDVNSPGGQVAASESLYLAVNRTAGEMPVVASVSGNGGSGAYYGMLPSERIYTTPGSLVGSVGVYASVPPIELGDVESVVSTGPDKGSIGNEEQIRNRVKINQKAFLETVYLHRGDELELTREELSYGKPYVGSRAVENGVADEIGDTETAIVDAAERAGLENYAVVRKESATRGFGIVLSDSDGTERPVAVEGSELGHDGVLKPEYYALYGVPQQEGVVINASD